jgi:hypothetical protein
MLAGRNSDTVLMAKVIFLRCYGLLSIQTFHRSALLNPQLFLDLLQGHTLCLRHHGLNPH